MNYSNSKKHFRQSNIELLRIIAMFLVLTVHANFWSLGAPSFNDFIIYPLSSWTKTCVQSISIVCVNLFILISGWFGIRSSLKGFLNYIFQCLYFSIGIYIILILNGNLSISVKGIAEALYLLHANWFILAYALLYLISPILNSFVENSSKSTFRIVIISFFLFQTIFGWPGSASWFEYGYSSTSLIGLYLLARYCKKYGVKIVTIWGGGKLHCMHANKCNMFLFSSEILYTY